jgi:hypothetical protein
MALGLLALAVACLAIAPLPVRSPWSIVWLVLGALLAIVAALISFGAVAVG